MNKHAMQHPITPDLAQLQHLARKLEHPTDRMLNITGELDGAGFFPAAWGGARPDVPLRGRPLMLLGQDQDSTAGFARSRKKGSEEYTPTWQNVMELLKKAHIPPEACFFTNFIMGARMGGGRNTGPSPALAQAGFMRQCAALFLEQVRIQRPQIILPLGMIPFQLLSLVSEDLRYRAMGIKDFKDLDDRDLTSSTVIFHLPEPVAILVAPLCHPCYPQNGQKRKLPQGRKEVDLLRELYASIRHSAV